MEMPYFEELAGEYGESVRFIGVNTGESENKIKDWSFFFIIFGKKEGSTAFSGHTAAHSPQRIHSLPLILLTSIFAGIAVPHSDAETQKK